MFTIGLLALAISASAEAKNIVKMKNTLKSEIQFKGLLNFFDCTSGMTACGEPYTSCGSGPQDQLAAYDAMTSLLCPGF